MQDLVSHALRTRLDTVLSRSLINCHAENLHSIMLLESPGQTIRMFVAEPGHELWRNHPRYPGPMSLGLHAHHCELSLSLVAGVAFNRVVRVSDSGATRMSRYRYNSQITAGKIGFTKEGEDDLVEVSFSPIGKSGGRATYMPADQIHSVAVRPGEWSAWFVMEGRENPAYENVTWSNADLAVADFDHLYKPMTFDKLKHLLSTVFSLAGNDGGIRDVLGAI